MKKVLSTFYLQVSLDVQNYVDFKEEKEDLNNDSSDEL